jgi:hypothetical protein
MARVQAVKSLHLKLASYLYNAIANDLPYNVSQSMVSSKKRLLKEE